MNYFLPLQVHQTAVLFNIIVIFLAGLVVHLVYFIDGSDVFFIYEPQMSEK